MAATRAFVGGLLWSAFGAGLVGVAASLVLPQAPLWASTAAGSLATSLVGWQLLARRG